MKGKITKQNAASVFRKELANRNAADRVMRKAEKEVKKSSNSK